MFKPRTSQFISTSLLCLTLFSAVTSAVAYAAADSEERADRVVDQAAVDMQDEADADLALLVERSRGTKREAEMLMRLAELRLEIASGLFRVAFGPGASGVKKAYLRTLSRGIEPLSRIIESHSKAAEYPHALFLRGKARKELAQGAFSADSLRDLEKFISRYPNREEASVAAMSIADLSIAKQNFGRAISVLTKLSSTPSDALYPNALAKRAWAFQADDKPERAMAELGRLASCFKSRAASKTLTAGDQALRESVMGDIPAIAFLAHESNSKKFSLSTTNSLFRSFDTGEGYQRMAIRFADHLRTADLNADLRAWKALVLKSDPSQKSLEMVIGILEYDLERDAYADVVKDAADVADVLAMNPAHPEAERARKLVIRTAEKLTKRITDYKRSDRATEAEASLLKILATFDRMSAPGDARRMALRWNLAETHFSLEEYGAAAASYRWLAANWNGDVKPTESVSPKKARLQAIESRYQSLRESKMIPESLEVGAKSAPKASAPRIAALREFIAWIEESEKLDQVSLEHYAFDAARALYAAGFTDEAMGRAKAMALSNPGAKHSLGAASLVVDTWIARQRWDQVEAEALAFSGATGWTSKTFAHSMLVQAAGAKFKRAELAFAAKNYPVAAVQAREFRKNYSKSNLSLDAMGIACNSDLSMRNLDSAVECFSSLASEFSSTKAARQALRTVARIEDDRLHYSAAADAYAKYLHAAFVKRELSATESYAIRKRILLLARAEGDAAKMESVSNGKKFCAPKLERECDLNRALAALIKNEETARAITRSFAQMDRGAAPLRSIWATVALGQARHVDPRAVNRAIQTLAKTWSATDPSIQYFLIARLTKTLPAMLEGGRNAVKSIPIHATEASITRRMRALQGFEARANLAVELPVNSIRASAQSELYLAYSDLIADLRAIPAPHGPTPAATAAMTSEQNRLLAGFVQPFILKARKIRDAALASDLREKRGLDADSADGLWDAKFAMSSEWSKAISDGNWSRVAFLSSEASEMGHVPPAWAKAARAVSLAKAGAAAEAKTVLMDACRDARGSSSLRDACRESIRVAKGRG